MRPGKTIAHGPRAAEPVWEVRYKRSVAADVRRLDAPLRRRIRTAIEERLAADPRRGKRLRGLRERESRKPLWTLPVGDYRVIYAFSDSELWVLVIRVGPRGGAYRGF